MLRGVQSNHWPNVRSGLRQNTSPVLQVLGLVGVNWIFPGSIEVVEGDIGMRDLGVGLEPCQYNRILLINRLSL